MKNAKRILAVLALVLAPLLAGVSQETLLLSGFVRSEAGAFVADEADYAVVRNTFDFNLERFGDSAALKVNPFIYQSPGEELEIGLREAFLDLYFDSLDLRIGRQQIIWGKAEGVFITDVVSPKDMRQFVLPPFDEIRLGVTAVKADVYLGQLTTELVWVPIFTPTDSPDAGSPWVVVPDYPVTPTVTATKEVSTSLWNSEVFAKVSYLGSALDAEVMGGWMWDDEPALHVTSPVPLTVSPEHHRLVLGGGSFSTTVSELVLRGEGALYHGKRLRTDESAVDEGLAEVDYLHYGLGLDWAPGDLKVSAQLIQQVILDYEDRIVQDQIENTITVLVARDFFRDTLHLELFSYVGLNEPDALLRPKAVYDFADGLDVAVGANVFVGDAGTFGQYDNNDMVYAEVKYSY